MKIKINSDRIFNVEINNFDSTIVNCKQKLNFLNEKNKIIRIDNQMKKILNCNVS